jgi:hypothetical protein
MADFFTELFQNIFTPGVGGPLLIATNAAFAALQLILGALLISTYSYHFAILSVLSAGLWVSINWFVRETAAVAARMAEEEKLQREREETEVPTVIVAGTGGSGSREVEPVEQKGELIERRSRAAGDESNTESTEGKSKF